VFAGIPVLLAALQALVVEYEFIIAPLKRRKPHDINAQEFLSDYAITGDLLDDLNDLIELRNEIIRPAHATCGASDNWPPYLSSVKAKGLLTSTGNPKADYSMLAQMASHRLFIWAVQIVQRLYIRVIESDRDRAHMFRPFLSALVPGTLLRATYPNTWNVVKLMGSVGRNIQRFASAHGRLLATSRGFHLTFKQDKSLVKTYLTHPRFSCSINSWPPNQRHFKKQFCTSPMLITASNTWLRDVGRMVS
jgi:hypothetical protein